MPRKNPKGVRTQGCQLDQQTRERILTLIREGAYPHLIRKMTGAGATTVRKLALEHGLQVKKGKGGGFHTWEKPKLRMTLIADPLRQHYTGLIRTLSRW